MATSRSNYKHNTPTFNVDRKIANFADFVDNIPLEHEELEELDRSLNKHEENEVGNISNKKKLHWNRVTHKMDDVSKGEVEDKLDTIEEVSEGVEHINITDVKGIAREAAIEFCGDEVSVKKGFDSWWKKKLKELKRKGENIVYN